MSHDNDFPEKHDAQCTRTHARPRPAKKPLAAQEGQRIPARLADERAYPAEAPSRSAEPRAPRTQVPTNSRAPRTQVPANSRVPHAHVLTDSRSPRAHVPTEPHIPRAQVPTEPHMPANRKPADPRAQRVQASGEPRPSRAHVPAEPCPSRDQASGARTSMSRPPKTAFAIAGACVALALALFGVVHWQNTKPIDIMANGQELQLPRAATVNDAFEAAGSPATAGNMLDIDGELLQEGSGTAYTATLDGQELDPATAADTPLDGHTSIDFANGVDIEEPSSTAENQPIAHGVQDVGHGPLHIVAQKGQDGSGTIKTGQVSGKQQVVEVTSDPIDTVMKRCYPDTQGEKVVALTFDDGPWDDTNELLDVLRDNEAKATFFTVGNRISGDGVDTVKREVAEGHQVATHTWDHAAGDGQSVNLSYMSAEQQREEITKGFQAIEDATGQTPSFVMRAPGGNFPTEVWSNVEDLVVADIGWDVDTTDWKRPEASRIAAELMRVTPGDIVLMHDGGGNRENTIEGLRIALPKLVQDGWKFVTIDELMKYPTKDS